MMISSLTRGAPVSLPLLLFCLKLGGLCGFTLGDRHLSHGVPGLRPCGWSVRQLSCDADLTIILTRLD